MNNKRQTIWLVSMLSLMVILSAYYLFTEDSGPVNPPVADSQQVDGMKQGEAKETAGIMDPTDGLVINEVVNGGKVSDDASAADPAGNASGAEGQEAGNKEKAPAGDQGATEGENGKKPDATTEKGTTAAPETEGKTEGNATKTDEEVLKEMEQQNTAVSASSQFQNYQWQREESNNRKYEELLTVAGDLSKTPEENAKATEQIRALEDKQAKITGIEETLSQQYPNAIVQEEADKYKVVVLSEKLDVKQAVSIVDLVMKELSVAQNKISVQYVTEQ
ncbi:SpoIIIAH-like family protein [Paenibacillus barcinonensis]|uniref:SpoIIIAH-like family protein n=1 Tax=Paenibacillus barcinonensis TaxID=198119 RepID=A0A2V4VWP4_PAEBA|nr:SpoIIIAH-like family protein [Paenibacillus barcinonensis]PYE51736.1 stage III sporulation protein AH [Paenibacillus barcinonensis]QKS56091.1 SpoIIIAH-like family protein [Paenibacillus barcinonensis]